jgi:hypothetical protein
MAASTTGTMIAFGRNLLIFAGLVGFFVLAARGWFEGRQQAEAAVIEREALKSATSVVKTVPRPQRAPLGLRKPHAIEQPFGRGEISGLEFSTAPGDPLKALPIERKWDVGRRDALGVADLPPSPPPEELLEPEASLPDAGGEDPVPVAPASGIADLPLELRAPAQAAEKKFNEALELMRSTQPGKADANQKYAQAAKLLDEARDMLMPAVESAPDNRTLLELMRRIKELRFDAAKNRTR